MPNKPFWFKGQYVEPAVGCCPTKMFLHERVQKPTRRAQNTPLFDRGDACRGPAEAGGGALSDFRKHQHRAVTYNQVQLACGTVQLPAEHHTSGTLQMTLRKGFVGIAALL